MIAPDRREVAAALETFVSEIGQLDDPARRHEEHRTELGQVSLVLRRDCHGVLRKLEARFPAVLGPRVREHLAPRVSWKSVAGCFDLADAPRLGNLYLLPDQLNVALRLEPERERVIQLLETLALIGNE